MLDRVGFFVRRRALIRQEQAPKPGSNAPAWQRYTEAEARDLAMLGYDSTLWRLALSPEIPADLDTVQRLPARVIWQAEVRLHALDRMEKRAKLEAAADEAARRAAARMARRG